MMNEAGHSIYIARLIARKALGLATPGEEAEIGDWARLSEKNREIYEDLLDRETRRLQYAKLASKDSGAAFLRVRGEYRKLNKRQQLLRLLPYAAAAILLISLGVWFSNDIQTTKVAHEEITPAEILPGGNRAILTLADGRTVPLSETQNGIVVGAEDITYEDGTPLGILPSEQLVLTTPKGGTYQVTLPDASVVWLNANSTLKYPLQFAKAERVVELTGEAYFDVKHIDGTTPTTSVPFRVKTENQTVEVLGTQFNISAYPDDETTKTTLVEGAVRLGSKGSDVILSPGEQGILNGDQFRIAPVNVADFIGWKNGEFIFNGIQLQDAMKQLSRWYDVEVVYEGEVPEMQFYGSFSRNATLADAMDILNEAKISFSILKVGAITQVVIKS